MDATKLRKRPHLIYKVDETELKFFYSSGYLKLLAVKCSKRSQRYSRRKRRNRDNTGLHECWIFPVVLCKGKYKTV
jgi:hypothetical protein